MVENANHWPAQRYGPSHDPEGFPIDYSITENGGPFRRPTIYHNDYRLEKQSTYGKVLPPGHSERFPPGTSDSVIRAQQIPQTTNIKSALGTPLVGVAPGLTDLGATAPAALAAPSSVSSARSQPPPLAERLHRRTRRHASIQETAVVRPVLSSGSLIIPEIYFGSEHKSYNKEPIHTLVRRGQELLRCSRRYVLRSCDTRPQRTETIARELLTRGFSDHSTTLPVVGIVE